MRCSDRHVIATTLMSRGVLEIFSGFGRLQAFVATQSGAKLGSLTCISTHAEIDAGKKTHDGVVQGWTIAEANASRPGSVEALRRRSSLNNNNVCICIYIYVCIFAASLDTPDRERYRPRDRPTLHDAVMVFFLPGRRSSAWVEIHVSETEFWAPDCVRRMPASRPAREKFPRPRATKRGFAIHDGQEQNAIVVPSA